MSKSQESLVRGNAILLGAGFLFFLSGLLLISSGSSFASLFLGARLLLEFPLSDVDTLKVFGVEGVGILANGLGAALLIAGFRREPRGRFAESR